MSLKWLTCPTKRLAQPISSSQLTMQLSDILGWDKNALTSSNFGTIAFAVLRNSLNTQMEIIQFDPTTIASSPITILTRGLDYNGGTVNVSANQYSWPANDTLVDLGSDLPQLFSQMVVDLYNNQTISGLKTFNTLPQSAATPTQTSDFATKTYVDAHGAAPSNYDQNIVGGIAGENLTAGWAVYLKAADGKWYGTLATGVATCDGVELGIAQSTVSSGGAVNVLIGGVDKSQSSLTLGAVYYLSNSKGLISTSPGTISVIIGQCPTTNSWLILTPQASNPNATQKAALVGESGTTPSATNKFIDRVTMTGVISGYAGISAPAGWLLCDASAVSRATYANLFALLNPLIGNPTMTLASPCVVTLNSHGMVVGDTFYFTTTGALPTGVSANTKYYVISAGFGANSFEFAASKGGSAINSSVSQSGTHSLYRTPYGLGDGSTTFNLPDGRANVLAGVKAADANFANLGAAAGEATHTLAVTEIPAHTHSVAWSGYANGSGGTGVNLAVCGNGGFVGTYNATTDNGTGGGGAHNNVQPSLTINYIIKT